jgi:3-oxoacyl-[acyl-carrier protein] reductase
MTTRRCVFVTGGSPGIGAAVAHPFAEADGAAKAGVVAFGQSPARALGPLGISVTAGAPGFTERA